VYPRFCIYRHFPSSSRSLRYLFSCLQSSGPNSAGRASAAAWSFREERLWNRSCYLGTLCPIRGRLAIISLEEVLEGANAWTRSRSPLAAARAFELCRVYTHALSGRFRPPICRRSGVSPRKESIPREHHPKIRVSLHNDLACHLRMNRAVVGIFSRLGECVGELFVRVPHLGLEHALSADNRMGSVIMVGPRHCPSDGYRDRLRPKTEIVDLYVHIWRGRLVARTGVRGSR
jgi:hypothetical protein